MRSLSFRGHPLHVILVDLPIGLWIGAFAADLAAMATGDPFWARVSWWAIAGGIVTALAAAVPGLVDYFRSVPPGSAARSTAFRHGSVNVGIVALYTLNLFWRGAELAPGQPGWIWAFGMSAVGVAALTYSGWLGGELVYEYQMGIERLQVGGNPTIYDGRFRAEPGAMVEVARADELEPGQVKHVVVNGAWLLLARTAGGWHAVDGLCTHEGGPLCDGMLVEGKIQCPWHGSRFDVATGAVEAGPADEPLGTWRVEVADGKVRVEAPEGG
ncbi:MAG TPA: DUF2231 domain-containing protein [Gemmatimonadota bacterium]|nr:DUF2231 domain-containing protein [Gemmatimonadota bacterium]